MEPSLVAAIQPCGIDRVLSRCGFVQLEPPVRYATYHTSRRPSLTV